MKQMSLFRRVACSLAVTVGILGVGGTAEAQTFENLQVSETPLVLKAQGSFFVGGDSVQHSREELSNFLPDGHVTVNQMYVRYMIPEKSQRHYPIVMIHGMALTGNSWETTPDGRMGWDEYFVRQGNPTFVVDQVGRGRSGFDQSPFNRVRAGLDSPKNQPPILRFTDESTWPNFRFGTKEGMPYPDTQYPYFAAAEASKQVVPDLVRGLPNPNPNYKALAELARQLGGAVLMSHSQSGPYPIEAALLDMTGIRGIIMVEPGRVPEKYTDEQIKKLTQIPILFIFGDHIGETPEGTGHSWKSAFDEANAFISRINNAGGNAKMLHLPEEGIKGNSHMIMQDKNNLKVADIVLQWLDKSIYNKTE